MQTCPANLRATKSCKHSTHGTLPIYRQRGHANIPHIALLPLYISIAYFIYHSACSTSINLNLAYLTKLNTAISCWYNTSVCEAPQHYKADNFLVSSHPHCHHFSIWSKPTSPNLGSQRCRRLHKLVQESQLRLHKILIHFNHLPQYVYIFYPSSPSHHSTFSSIQQTTGRTIHTIDNIINHHRSDLFNHYNPNIRCQLSCNCLTIFPLLNDDGTERPIYTELSYHIQRCFGTGSHSICPLGILMDLCHLDHLFLSDNLLNNFDSDAVSPSLDIYPQAGLITAGHFQADGLMPAFIPLLHKLNSDIQLNANDSDVDDPFSPQDSLPSRLSSSHHWCGLSRVQCYHACNQGPLHSTS